MNDVEKAVLAEYRWLFLTKATSFSLVHPVTNDVVSVVADAEGYFGNQGVIGLRRKGVTMMVLEFRPARDPALQSFCSYGPSVLWDDRPAEDQATTNSSALPFALLGAVMGYGLRAVTEDKQQEAR